MLRISLGRIPIEVHFSHLLVGALFALATRPTHASSDWPNRVLLDSQAAGYPRALAIYVVGWMGVFFISILVHEMGHAVASRLFGYRPTVRLMWLGGHTDPNPNETIPWNRDLVMTLAGPFFGMALMFTAAGLQWWLGDRSEVASYFLRLLVTLNLGWTVLNLIPVPPLDGGKVATTLLVRLFGRPGFLVAQALALLVAGGVIALALLSNPRENLFIVLFFSTFAFRAAALVAAYFRGDAPASTPLHPLEALFGEALALVQQDKLDEAKSLLERLLEKDTSVPLRSRLHHLRGWVAIKEGSGREALDHFSQVQRDRVEPQAVAAAFCLVGDDERSLPLWEAAYAETRDRTVLHEWAGAMIRAGRVDEALRMAGVQPATAFHCAQHVLSIRERFEDAARLGETALLRDPQPALAYDTACAWARAGRRDEALDGLRRAQALGFSDFDSARADPDLVSLHGWPPFEGWLRTALTRR